MHEPKPPTVYFTLDLKRRRIKVETENTKQNSLIERAELEISDTPGKVQFDTATAVHAAATCTKLIVKKSFELYCR